MTIIYIYIFFFHLQTKNTHLAYTYMPIDTYLSPKIIDFFKEKMCVFEQEQDIRTSRWHIEQKLCEYCFKLLQAF